jgi:hypothetical protein
MKIVSAVLELLYGDRQTDSYDRVSEYCATFHCQHTKNVKLVISVISFLINNIVFSVFQMDAF